MAVRRDAPALRTSAPQRVGAASRCELTDTYSPAAIDNAPAISPAIPAVTIAHPTRRMQAPPVGSEHGGAQPVGPVAGVDRRAEDVRLRWPA